MDALLSTATRSYDDLRSRIDAKLGDGIGLAPAEAAKRLSPAEHAVWALDNLLACLTDYRLHIWDQGFCSSAYDGPAAIDAIAEGARALDPTVADLLRWTARWPRTRSIALVSVVPYVWEGQLAQALPFLKAVAGRWNDEAHPLDLPTPPPFAREELAPGTGTPRFPGVAVGFGEAGRACPVLCPRGQQDPVGVFRAAVWALWRAGAPDEALDVFFAEYFHQGADEVDVLGRWISFDGDGGDEARRAALREAMHPITPLARWLGVAEVPGLFLLLAGAGRLEELRPHFEGYQAIVLPDDRGEAARALRGALHFDPDLLVAHGGTVDDALLEPLGRALGTGHSVVVLGSGPAVDRLAATAAGQGVTIFDRRGGSA